jgi:hypothetical protein
MEQVRINAIFWSFGAVTLGVLIAIINLFVSNSGLFMSGLIIMITGLVIGSKKTQYYRRKFKEVFIRDLFKKEFNENVYINWDGMDLLEIEDAFVIPVGNSNRSDDEIIFDYKGVKIRRSDVLTEKVVNTGKTRSTVRLFKGQYMIFSFPKEIKGFTVIKDNEWLDSKPGGILSGAPDTERVKMESVEFNEQFAVFSNDPQEAFYLLTPQLMEILLDFRKTYGVEVYFGFVRNEFHVAINSDENLFEPALLKPVTKVSVDIYNNDIARMKRIVEQLELIKEEN